MKIKVLFSLLLGSALTLSAQGYKDGIEYYKADQYKNAKEILERNLNASSTDQAEANFYLGKIALKDKDLATARAKFNAGIAANANNAFNHVGLGEIALREGNVAEAENQFKAAQKLSKKDPKLITEIARAYYNADPVKYEKNVEKLIAQAQKINPQEPAICILRGDIQRDKEDWGVASACYEEAIMYDPDCVEAYVKYANVYSYVNRDFSISKLQELLKKRPNSALAQRELAEKFYENDQWAKAAQVYGEYIKNPNHFKEDESRYAVLLYYGQKYDEATNMAQKVLSEDANDFGMKRIVFLSTAAKANELSESASELSKKEPERGKEMAAAATDLFREAKVLGEKFFANNVGKKYNANDFVTLGNVLKELEEYPAAVEQFEKAVQNNPERNELLKELSKAYSLANRDEDAVKAMSAYINAVGEDNASNNDLYALSTRYFDLAASAEGVAKIEAADNALKYINIVEQRITNNYRIPFLKTRILYLKNNGEGNEDVVNAAKQTIKVMEETNSVAKDAKNYRLLCTIVTNYCIANDKPTARQYYQKMIDADPNHPDNAKILEYLKKL